MLRVAHITRFPVEHYSRKFLFGMQRLPLSNVVLCAKYERYDALPQGIEVQPCWTSLFYPLQVTVACIKARVHLVHIQHEFNMFGPIYSVVLATFLAFLLKKIARKRVVLTAHTVIRKQHIAELLKATKFSYIPEALVRFLLSCVYIICNISDATIVHTKSHIFDLLSYGVKKKKVIYLPHGVEDNTADPADTGAVSTGPQQFILYFGFVAPRKGIEYLLDAYIKLRRKTQFKPLLIVAGGIKDKKYITKLKLSIPPDLRSDIVFTGFVGAEEIPRLFRCAGMLALPYIVSVGNSSPAMHAITYGTPLVATAISPFVDEFNNLHDALLVRPKDPDSLFEAINLLFTDASLRQSIASNISKRIRCRSWPIIAGQIFHLYRQMIK